MEEISTIMNRSSELCFKKEDFMADDFSVDKFVSVYRKQTSLENIKEDLGLFLKVLHTAMVELINRDYTDFVNLSSNLVGLDKSIKTLSSPLKEVKTKVSGVLSKLENTLSLLQDNMQKREAIHQKKVLLHRVISVLEGIENIEKHQPINHGKDDILSMEIIERISVEYSRIQFHMSQGVLVNALKGKEPKIQEISNFLLHQLDNVFIHSLSCSDSSNLYRVLRVYSSIEKVNEVEYKFQVAIVRPYMRQVIDEEVMRKEGIGVIYERILEFIPQKCAMLLDVTRGGKRDVEVLKEYDFIVNAVWPEIIICLDYIAPVVFNPGNPSNFHKNYTSSMKFLDEFELLCRVQASVKRLRNHPSYKSFMNRWNLDVYFEIRFQEIAGFFETALLSPLMRDDNKENFFLHASAVLSQSLRRCWAFDVYIKPLRHKFWKLTLQLLSRYSYWVNSIVKEVVPILNTTGDGRSTVSESVSTIEFVMLVHDIELIVSVVRNLFEKEIVKNFEKKHSVDDVLESSIKTLLSLVPNIGNVIISRLTVQCTQHLKLITDIPRLYRKTNREVPTKPSGYVSMVLSPLSSFLSDTESIDISNWKTKWICDIINSIIEQCLTMTSDVLTSIKKMEDSLKRLKKVREKSSGTNVTGAVSDDDKIRQQLVLDVEYLGNQISKYGYDKNSGTYRKLEELVLSAVKTGALL